MKIYSDRLTFTHYRGLPCSMTLALQLKGEDIQIAWAICSPSDAWNRKRGRMIAANRFADAPTLHLPVATAGGKVEGDVCTLDKARLLYEVLAVLAVTGAHTPKHGEASILPRDTHRFVRNMSPVEMLRTIQQDLDFGDLR